MDYMPIDIYPFSEIERYHIVENIGVTSEGQKMIMIFGHKIPNSNIDYNLVLRFILYVLQLNSESGIYVVYFHSDVKVEPTSLRRWVKNLIDVLNVNRLMTKKINISRIFIVHPTFLLKVLLSMVAPVLKISFGNKIVCINTLHDLKRELPDCEITFHLSIQILEYDKLMTEKRNSNLDRGLQKQFRLLNGSLPLIITPPRNRVVKDILVS